MSKIAIVLLADVSPTDGLGRAVNALAAAAEHAKAGDEVAFVFSGAGTKWPAELRKADHPAHGLYEAVRDHIQGACAFCANAFEQTQSLASAEVPLLDDDGAIMSYRAFTSSGYRVLTF